MRVFIYLAVAIFLVSGCSSKEPAPTVYVVQNSASKFDQSWAAVNGALYDQGLLITSQNRSTGVVLANSPDINVTATVRTQADGSVRVQFDTKGDIQKDPMLIERVTRSYNARMGR